VSATAMAPPNRGHHGAETTATTMKTTTKSSPPVRPSIDGERSLSSSPMDAVVGLGSNLGDRRATLVSAASETGRIGTLTGVSALYETDPVGPPQPAYLNAAVRLLFDGSALELFQGLLVIEQRLGRIRRERWGPRTIDLDLLFIDGKAVEDDDLVVPHARLGERRFALAPLLDVFPDARHPKTGEPLRAWLDVLPEQGVQRIESGEWAGSV
jgi:2-amino-4-hydroxy-6-hydroxymethyldihydropteridine diphosphokinase